MENSVLSMVMNSSLDSKYKYQISSVNGLSDDLYVKESCENIINFNQYIIENDEFLKSIDLLNTVKEKADFLLEKEVDELVNFYCGHYNNDEFKLLMESFNNKKSILKEFVESCKSCMNEGRELPDLKMKVLLESTSISERKKNDILMEYYELNQNDKDIVDLYFECVKNEQPLCFVSESTSEEEKARVAKMKAQEKIIGLAMSAIAVGTVIKVSEALYLRRLLKSFAEMHGIRELSSLQCVRYDEDEIPKQLKSKLIWNDVDYNYKMEVYTHKGKVVCGRVYAYKCSAAKIKFNLLSQPKNGATVKVNYFTNDNSESKQNYYMASMALEDRIGHESIKRIVKYMKMVNKENKK